MRRDSHRTRTIAVLLTCHNRRQTTLGSLEALHACSLRDGHALEVFVVDDGSSDGTAAAVLQSFPAVRLIEGTGELYWNGGMRKAFSSAMQVGYPFYLWLNDDTLLEDDAIERLLSTFERLVSDGQPLSIVVGSTRDARTGELTYGGVVQRSRWHPLRLGLVEPSSVPLSCDTFFGNCVLIPAEVARIVGNLDPAFTHSMGDADYGFRAHRMGCSMWVAPGFVGTCTQNPKEGAWEDRSLPLRDRWRQFHSPKGLPPAEWRVILQRQAPVLWPIYLVLTYARLLAGSVLSAVRRTWNGPSR
jgi:GT2 family glycosyltransferase